MDKGCSWCNGPFGSYAEHNATTGKSFCSKECREANDRQLELPLDQREFLLGDECLCWKCVATSVGRQADYG